jgi:hypothetical protein
MTGALTIRFIAMCLGMAVLTVVLNLVEPADEIVMASLVVYLVGGGLLIARYCAAHEDEMPPLPPRGTHRS